MHIVKHFYKRSFFSTTHILSSKRIDFDKDKHAIDLVIEENYNEIYDKLKHTPFHIQHQYNSLRIQYYSLQKQYNILLNEYNFILEQNKRLRSKSD